ncbi:S-layer homology domain-containing protein, partial [Cohnella sp. 56]|uniref:S-layer homology domain-containing protein n=1 Tax=Cohnella sp. 56 TaxID=3113722 RepID=UPI0030E98F47
DATVKLVLTVTRTSDASVADTAEISVVVPAKSETAPVEKTAAEIAGGIADIAAPEKDAEQLTLPSVPNGFTVAIKSSSNEAVIGLDGKIVPPAADATVKLVLTVTRTSDASVADTAEISVVVPAKSETAPVEKTAAEIAGGIADIAAPEKDAEQLTLPNVPNGFTVAIKSSSNEAVIGLDGKIVPPVADATVKLVLTVTRTSDASVADTAEISVVVPAKSETAPVEKTAAEIADGIADIAAPEKDATQLTLPSMPNGFTVAIKSSSNEAVIGLDGKIVPPAADATVKLVLTVTRTSDASVADTAEISVVVPAKSETAPVEKTAAEIAGGIADIAAPEKDATQLMLPSMPNGFTVAIKSSSNEAVIGLDGKIVPPAADATVKLVLTVTRTSDASVADTAEISVVVPAKSETAPVEKTAAEIAGGIADIAAPEKDATQLTLPSMPSGFTVAIKSSSNEAIIGLDGKIVPSAVAATVKLVLTVTRTSDASVADTAEISVVVPAKSETSTPPPTTSTPTPTPAGTISITKDSVKTVDGKAIVQLASDTTDVKLTADALAAVGERALVLSSGSLTVQVPSSVIAQLIAQLPSAAREGASVELRMSPIAVSDAEATIAKGAASGSSKIKLAGGAYEFTLKASGVSGDTATLSRFSAPITLSLAAFAGADNDLTGVYYIGDDGKLEYVGGKLANGVWTAEVKHFSKYAVLEVKRTFADVADTFWASRAIASLAAKQIVSGVTDTTFEPGRTVTRAEFTKLLVGTLGLTDKGAMTFKDVASDAWYADCVAIAVKAGIVSGKSADVFDPNGRITREEMASMLVKAYKVLHAGTNAEGLAGTVFADGDSIAAWAKQDVAAASALGLLKGRASGTFAPKGTATRAEAAQAIFNLISQ